MHVVLRRVTALLLVAALLLTSLLSVGTKPADAQGSFDQELIRLANNHRTSLGIAPLVSSSSLSADALSWSQQMLRTGRFAHAPGLGSIGENIAFSDGPAGVVVQIPRPWSLAAGPLPSYCTSRMDVTTAKFIMCGWLSSQGHRRNLENSSYRQIGSGTAAAPGGFGRLTYSTHRFSSAAPTTPPPAVDIVEPGHSVDANASGDKVMVALKADGKLWLRRDLGTGWSSWQGLGAGGWAATDASIGPNGTVHVAAVKGDGRLFTRRWSAGGSWGGWVNHGAGWDADTTPSISSNSSRAFLGAITASGVLKTKVYRSSWSAATTHGRNGWAHVDVDTATDGDLWYAAVKSDGRLYLRKNLGSGWSNFAPMGAPTWSAATPPAISARSNGVVFAAVKADGRLYTRQQANGRWFGYVRQGVSGWASVDVAISEQGHVSLAAHKTWGRLYTHHQAPGGAWSRWMTHGLDTWSTRADASIAIAFANQPVLLAVKQNGVLYYRVRGSSWSAWAQVGRGNWAVGS